MNKALFFNLLIHILPPRGLIIAMSRQGVRASDAKKINTELFTFTYGALVAQLVKDFDTDEVVNEQLEKIGFNIGSRLVEDYLAKGNSGRCTNFRDTANGLVKGFKMFLGITPTISKFSQAGDEFSLVIDSNNPLTEFVDLPRDHPSLLYSNVLVGAIKGALHNVQLDVDARFVQDILRGDQTNEIRVKFIRRIEEVITGED
ncbi:unnamed protein product [Protopolystoma xenopodis]|uniref:Trafficking protein particle complex subunit n=1 Tax=Protopolystoma xenopodis TaxID=117903 RepID=A0A3S5CH77_9PLAT|nr:unnamed protein product [Protopolystoma xenopodis]